MPKKSFKKEFIFVDEYLKDFNGSRAAQAAGYSKWHAYELLKDPKIISAIERRKAERSKRLELDTDLIVSEISQIALNPSWDMESKGLGAKVKALELLLEHVKITDQKDPAKSQDFATLMKKAYDLRKAKK